MKSGAVTRLVVLWGALTLLCVPVRPATTVAEVDEDQKVESAFVTPHVPWAKPYAKGRLRVLFLINAGNYSGDWFAPGTRLREVTELAQRFNLARAGCHGSWEIIPR